MDAKQCHGKDVFERMNYLYQASQDIVNKNLPLASQLGSLMFGCAKKAVLRLEPDIKRTMCKSCHTPLVPGKTAKVRLKSKPTKVVKWTCLACGHNRKIPTKQGYNLWSDQPESVRCIIDCNPKPKPSKSRNDSSKTKNEKEIKMEVDLAKNDKSHKNES